LRTGAGVALAACLATAAYAARADYTGSKACAACHAEIYASWQNTAHARAGTSAGKRAERRCQGCHMTGDAPAGDAYFAGVGCEACHGAGAAYSPDDLMRDRPLAQLLGLRDLSTAPARAAVCASCHRVSTRLAPFDPEAAWASIRHEGAPPLGPRGPAGAPAGGARDSRGEP
jgi:hypothetical protein